MPAAVARLKHRSEFLRVAGSGNKCAMPGVVVQKRSRPSDETPAGATPETVRYGLTASRRVGKAVQRNRARRRLRAAAEQVLPTHAEAGCDYVLIGRTETLHRPFAALLGDLTRAVERLSRPRPARRRDRAPRERAQERTARRAAR